MKCKRILLKLSGESLTTSKSFGIAYAACSKMAQTIKNIRDSGIELAIVIGGGNIFRGISLNELGMHRTPADQMGMLATLMNGVALQQALEKLNCPTRVMSALECPKIVESYNWHQARNALDRKEIIIFVGGTGNPYFTTDTAAAMRAGEIEADLLVKATKVDGIYDKDPLKYPDALKYHELTYEQVLAQKLEVMDATSIALCMHNRIPLFVLNMALLATASISQLLVEKRGTLVKEKKQ